MKAYFPIMLLSFLSMLSYSQEPLQLNASNNNDPGAQIIGEIKSTLIYATDNSEKSEEVKGKLLKVIKTQCKLDYKKYYDIGSSSASIFRSYQGWLQPIKGSEKMMLSFEPKSVSSKDIAFTVHFWQDNKKVFTTDTPKISYDEPFFITGPAWRSGKLLFILEANKS